MRSGYEDMGKKVRKYLYDNTDSLHDSNLTFSQFLEIFGLSKDDYVKAVRSTLKTSKKRKEAKIIRYYLAAVDRNPEVYFYSLLMLYLPWKNEQEFVDIDLETKFNKNKELILKNREEFSKVEDETLEEYVAEAQRRADAENSEDSNLDEENQNNTSEPVLNPFRASRAQGTEARNLDEGSEDHVQDFRLFTSPEDNGINDSEFNPEDHVGQVEQNTEETSVAVIDRYIRPDKISSSEFHDLLTSLNAR
ncbi:hypothetical protein BD560DRAFT_428822 [Blakeslea trispora]|nr:hypothetical protein BD560DRAFT_428822 [Blakeslea trispora]